jgi:hypothetical protein
MNKLTLMRAATACLYLGPLLAGLGGYGWAMVPVFSMLLVAWLVLLRPESWPAGARRADGDAWVTITARAAVQVLLVAVLFGIGRGIGGVMEFVHHVPLWLPVVISASAILLGRAIWSPLEPQGEARFAG